MRRAVAIPVAVAVSLFVGVVAIRTVRGRNASRAATATRAFESMSTPAMAAPPAAAPSPNMAGDAVVDGNTSPAFGSWIGQKLVRSAEVRLQVQEAAAAANRIDSMARAHDGMIADSRITQADRAPTDVRIVLRVPADSFDAVIGGVRRIGRVRSENTSMGDVTRQYTDLDTRLAVKEQTAAQLRGLLATRTGKLSDVLEVEQMKAQRREYDREVAVSSIAITLFEPASEGWTSLRSSIADSFREMTDVLASSVGTIVYLVAYLVPWAIVGTAGWWCVRAIRRAY